MPRRDPETPVVPINKVLAVRNCITAIINREICAQKEEKLKKEYEFIFSPIPHFDELPTDFEAHIKLINSDKFKTCNYPCPHKFKEVWGILIEQHLKAGIIRPSSSRFASPAFIMPKVNLTVLPHWVNDYQQLNANTITDSHPILRIDDILSDCAKGKIWATLDMTNSFFQTKMHPDDVHLTAVSMLFGLYEWLVMPMGLKNAPSIHQCHVTAALRQHLDSCIETTSWQDLPHIFG